MSDAEKVDIVYLVTGSEVSRVYTITVPVGWDWMTPEQRETWARNVIRRKSSDWIYVQIDGYPY